MLLSDCSVTFITIFFELIKLGIDHIGWVLFGLLVLAVAVRSALLSGLVVEGISLLDDLIGNIEIASGGVFGVLGGLLLSVTLSVLLGLAWAMFILISPTNIILKVIAAPFYFLLGTIWGFFPWSIPGVNFGLRYILQHRMIATILCVVPVILFVLIFFFFGESICSITMWMHSFF